MEIAADVILSHLKAACQRGQARAEAQVRPHLQPREQQVWDWLFKQYQDESKKRWYDPFHIAFSTAFALRLFQAEGLSRLIVPGIILHDVGYFALVDKNAWNAKEARITHMQEGAPLAARVLMDCGYTSVELEQVVGMICCHDNPYIGLPIRGRDRLGMRDCDRIWVMHLGSFYKDLCSKSEAGASAREFLYQRLSQFFASAQPFGIEWEVSPEQVAAQSARIEPQAFGFTRACVQKQFAWRMAELKQGILNDEIAFERAITHQLPLEGDF